VAIAGTHGKSTTTAMTASVLAKAGLAPSFIVGARVPQLGGSSGIGTGQHFVVEACEYSRNFLHLAPRFAAVLNIEPDHLDYYDTMEALTAAFAQFARQVAGDGVLVVCEDDAPGRTIAREATACVESFGLASKADWRAEALTESRGLGRFELWHGSRRLGDVGMSIPGRHNVTNALAAAALAHHCGCGSEAICQALGEYQGADRRLSLRGQHNGVTVLDDYAHHPTEIAVTVRAARAYYQPRRLWVIFQPHQHSRTRFLLSDFARSFGQADAIVVPNIYFVRDSEAERGRVCADDLVERIRQNGGDAVHLPTFERIVDHLMASIAPGDVVLTMGAGDVWKVADELLGRLGAHRPGERSA
jgi:UDP-N-acetylmuramate--alanine ligase